MVLSLKTWVMLILLGIGATFLAWGVWIRITDPRGRFCAAPPGLRRPWRWLRWLWPVRWVLVKACFYDLSGLRGDARSAITCPECGTSSRRALRSTRRLRRITIGLTCIIAGAATPRIVHRINWTCIANHLPARALIVIEQVLGPTTPMPFRSELRSRFWSANFDVWETDHFLDLLVRDLRADGLLNNGEIAFDMLQSIPALAMPALERALKSNDWQQRQLAAYLLREGQFAEPTEELIRATFEGLRDPSLQRDRVDGRYRGTFNTTSGMWYLVPHAQELQPMLIDGLHSGDARQRFLSAAIAAHGGCHRLADEAVPILIEHLKDNDVSGDADTAMYALDRFGPLAFAQLDAMRDSPDRQQNKRVHRLLVRLVAPEE